MNTVYDNGGNFIFGGCDTIKLAEKYGTPLYVVNEEEICNRAKEIRDVFLSKYNNTRALYASKAFLTKKMCKIIDREGLGLDVVSGGELFTAIKAGFPVEKIMFHGNNKSLDELSMAVTHDVGRIVVDNLWELEMLNEIAKKYQKKAKILFRITPGVAGNTHKYIFTGQKDSKFGIPLNDEIIEEAILTAQKSSNIELMGFHFHVGSQLFDNQSHVSAIGVLINLMKYVKINFGQITRELNVGGGFGIRYVEGDEPKPLGYFTEAIMETILEECKNKDLDMPTVIIEPGRWIIGEAGITLYTIGAIKTIPDIRTYISVDGGLPDNPRPALYDAKYHAVVANKYYERADELVTVAGKCCESGDILIEDLRVPKVQAGDLLAVLSTGAYNYSMASNYNRLPRPAVVLVNNGIDELMVRRETYEDLLRYEE